MSCYPIIISEENPVRYGHENIRYSKMTTHRCEGIIKTGEKRGERCPYNASYRAAPGNGRAEAFFCFKHKASDAEAMANARPIRGAVASSGSSAAAAHGSNVGSLYNDIYDAIFRRISCGDVGDAPHFVAMTRMTSEERMIVIRRASEISGSRDDVLLIAAEIGRAITDYNHACSQRRVPLVVGMERLRNIGAQWDPNHHLFVSEGPNHASHVPFCAEEGSFLAFPDVAMVIANGSQEYLKKMGVDFTALCEEEGIVYMGPRDIIRTPLGEAVPRENSEWYIPLPRNCPLRQVHNKSEVVRILDAISRGENGETAEKYLALQGKTLVCVCVPYPCHCEVYVEVVRELLKRSRPTIPSSTD